MVSWFHFFLSDLTYGALHPSLTCSGLSCNPGFSSPSCWKSSLLLFCLMSCFLDPTPSFLFLGLCFYFAGAWEIKFLMRSLMPCSFLFFCLWPDFFLSSPVALISFLHPPCSEISWWSASVSGGPLIWKLTSFSTKAFAYIISVIIILPPISLSFWIIYSLDVISPGLSFWIPEIIFLRLFLLTPFVRLSRRFPQCCPLTLQWNCLYLFLIPRVLFNLLNVLCF